ncbi:exonuclease SbcCD subunit D [Allostreptomyces psammosilenae]|uniref:Nuclease SbcCD subunit D n=1 Tax=Allostreptomyces psammosilenae TaxID=1892865 RepID=A0A852ZRU8_9ACTN|nr:exonuclease SbcCD subunit D [Allostreptomyces psammosilenae]NYI05113.1 exonuclease SbcD [Allostreptomyces psammosilenae]
MRLLHTSDWHLGRSFHREDLIPAQAAFLAHLVEVVRRERVDAVLMAGDVHDRAIPSLEAVRLYDETLRRLAALRVPVVLISGNHDSAARLGVHAGPLAGAGIHLCTDPARSDRPALLEDAHGPVAVYGVPYLEPALVRGALGLDAPGAPSATAAAVHAAALDRIRADLARRPAGTRSIVLAHAFATGGVPCDSEREITVGGIGNIPTSLFAGIDYVALGHLHGAQTLDERIRYSGSPLAYSFSEAGHRKSMWLVDLDGAGAVTTERVDCPVPRPLARLRGTLEELLTSSRFDGQEDAWVQATLTDAGRPHDAMARLRRRFPHTLQLAYEPPPSAATVSRSYTERLRGRSDHDVALDFVAHVRGSAADREEEALLREAFDAVRRLAADREDLLPGPRTPEHAERTPTAVHDHATESGA